MFCGDPAWIVCVIELAGRITNDLAVLRVRPIRGAECVPARFQLQVVTAALTAERVDHQSPLRLWILSLALAAGVDEFGVHDSGGVGNLNFCT